DDERALGEVDRSRGQPREVEADGDKGVDRSERKSTDQGRGHGTSLLRTAAGPWPKYGGPAWSAQPAVGLRSDCIVIGSPIPCSCRVRHSMGGLAPTAREGITRR